MKIWGPDTCECRIEEIYNGAEIVGGGQVLRKCAAHGSVPDDELYGVLYSNPDGENKRKNQFHRMLLGFEDGVPGLNLAETKRQPDGSDHTALKEGVTFNWAWTGQGRDRVLVASINGASLSAQQRAAIVAACNVRFGAGKVTLS